MTVPSSDRFDIIDYNYRALSHGEGETLESGEIIGQSFVLSAPPDANSVVINGDGLQFTTDLSKEGMWEVISSLIIEDSLEYVSSSGVAGSGIPSNYTFEFDIMLTEDLPLDFSDIKNRLFVGALNQQGYSSGLIFSHQGIAYVDSPEDPTPNILGGSLELLIDKAAGGGFYPEGLNIRVAVNGELGRVTIYATPAVDAYDAGSGETNAPVVFSAQAKPTNSSFGDSIVVRCTGRTDVDTHSEINCAVRSIRLASTNLIPTSAPVAVADGPQFMSIGESEEFTGIDSYDPEGNSVTHNWEIEVAPEGSNATLQGASRSFTNLQIVSSYDGSMADIVRITYLRPTAESNSIVVYVTRGGVGSELSLSFNPQTREMSIVLAEDEDGITTTATDLVAAFTDRLSKAFDVQIGGGFDEDSGITYPQLFRADLVAIETAGSEILEEGTFFFSGGSGSSLPNPTLIADKEGIYVISLQVSNGKRRSKKSRVTTTASLVSQLLGHRPNSKYIFKYLPDFWKLVKNKDQIETVWSSMTQVLSNELLQCWQNDYAKSLKDISRKYQRRWLNLPTSIEVDVDVPTTLIQESYRDDELTIPHVDDGERSRIASSVEMWMDDPITTGLKLVKSSLGLPYVVDVVSVEPIMQVAGTSTETDTIEHKCEGIPGAVGYDSTTTVDVLEPSGKFRILTNSTDFQKYKTLEQRTAGYFLVDPANPNAPSPVYTDVFTDVTYPLHSVGYDILRIKKEGGSLFATVAELEPEGLKLSARLSDLDGNPLSEHVDGFALNWDILREASNVYICSTPYLKLGDAVDVSGLGLHFGDLCQIDFIDPYSNEVVTLEVPILATSGNFIFVEWYKLLRHLNDQSVLYNDTYGYAEGDINSLTLRIKSIIRTRVLEQVEDLVSAPTLGFSTILPEYAEGVDYTISDGVVTITDYFNGSLKTVSGSPVVEFNPGYLRHSEIETKVKNLGEPDFEIIGLMEVGVHAIQIESGADAGTYLISNIDEVTNQIVLDRPLTCTSDACVFRSPVFCSFTRPTGSLWAEVSFFDNWHTIQKNFGVFVGLPKDVVDNYDGNLDYLSVIKSMWFAFLSGPNFSNIQLAVQSLFGLPFSEVASQLTFHDPAEPGKDGTLLLTSEDNRVFTYTYPYGAELAVNPRTGRQIKAFAPVDKEDIPTLSDEAKRDLQDSVVDAYVNLVDVVRVEDYISDPELIENVMRRNDYTYVDDENKEHVVDLPPSLIQKYHTFLVDVPLDLTRTTATFPLIRDFLKEVKPAYTNFILQGSLLLSDEINVVSEPVYKPTLMLTDTPHTSPFFAMKKGVDEKFGKPMVTAEDELLIWPVEKTYEKLEIDYTAFLEASHFCISGPYCFLHSVLAGHSVINFDEDVLGRHPGVIDPDGTIVWSPAMEEILKCIPNGADVLFNGGVAIAIPGTGNFELYSTAGKSYNVIADPINPGGFIIHKAWVYLTDPYDWTLDKDMIGELAPYKSLNCLFFTSDNWPPPSFVENWDDYDVKEKYESGYCEGVLDDYSGDGSWNMRRGQLDMVNTVNSDVDVVRSRMWVHIRHDWTTNPAQKFFQVGEKVSVTTVDGSELIDPDGIWTSSPPVILHVGYGENPRLPHVSHPGISSGDQKNSYLLLGFENTRDGIMSVEDSDYWDYIEDDVNNFGHESRLKYLDKLIGEYGSTSLRLKGRSSEALAVPIDDSGAEKPAQLYKETIWQVDKLIENGPASDPTFTLTTYFPVDMEAEGSYPNGTGGLAITEFRGTSPSFDPDHADPIKAATAFQYQWETQQRIIDETTFTDPDSRMIPSFNPGFYTGWDLEGGVIDVEKVVWGFDDDGSSLATTPVNIGKFKRPSNHAESYLQNVHMGMTLSARKDRHLTHGFTNFRIPAPSIKMILPSSAGYDLRVCGFYFCDDDPSRTSIPNSSPESFGDPGSGEGVIGGSWIFFRNSETLEEFADVKWNFEKGNHEGFPILPKGPLNDGTPTFILGSSDQRSDGHIIECHIPELPSEGYYDIIIRNYRPYLEPGENHGDADTWAYHMDESIAKRAYFHSPDGHGIVAWGTDPFGAGGAE